MIVLLFDCMIVLLCFCVIGVLGVLVVHVVLVVCVGCGGCGGLRGCCGCCVVVCCGCCCGVVALVVVVSDAIFDDVYGHKASAMHPTATETNYCDTRLTLIL